MRRLYRLLVSRKLAVWLIGLTGGYSMLATLLPLGDARSPEVAQWAVRHPELEAVVGPLGLHQPFTTPVFVMLAALLTMSTAACSWERTTRARAYWRAARVGDAVAGITGGRPTFALSVEPDGNPRDEAVARLGSLGLRVQTDPRDPSLVLGSRSRWTVFGSPLFHWSLVVLFASAGLGQLTRSEGEIHVVDGAVLRDERASYALGLTTGPWFGDRFSGADIEVESVERALTVDGINRGDSPVVRVRRGDRVLARGAVYPNHPLSFGSVVIHRGDLGPALRVSFRFPNGMSLSDQPVSLPDTIGEGRGTGAVELTADVTGDVTAVSFEQASGSRVIVSVDAAGFRSAPLAVGAAATLPGDITVTIDELTVFARLTVVNDWSVPFIYIAFVAAAFGATAALLLPPRVVAVVCREGEPELSVWVLRKRIDPAFPPRVRRAFGVEPRSNTEENHDHA